MWDPPLLIAAHLTQAGGQRLIGPFITNIDENLAVGSFPMRGDVQTLVENKVVAVVNMCAEWPGPLAEYDAANIEQLWLPTVDTVAPAVEDLRRGLDFMREQLAANPGKRVFIHCKGGRGRAATMALSYLIVVQGMYVEQAFAYLKGKRSVTSSSVLTYPQLAEIARDRNQAQAPPASPTPTTAGARNEEL
jgi:atypical dual specificity phosphatase